MRTNNLMSIANIRRCLVSLLFHFNGVFLPTCVVACLDPVHFFHGYNFLLSPWLQFPTKKKEKKNASNYIASFSLSTRKQANEAEELLSEWVVTWAATATTITTDRLSMKVFHLFSRFFFSSFGIDDGLIGRLTNVYVRFFPLE